MQWRLLQRTIEDSLQGVWLHLPGKFSTRAKFVDESIVDLSPPG